MNIENPRNSTSLAERVFKALSEFPITVLHSIIKRLSGQPRSEPGHKSDIF